MDTALRQHFRRADSRLFAWIRGCSSGLRRSLANTSTSTATTFREDPRNMRVSAIRPGRRNFGPFCGLAWLGPFQLGSTMKPRRLQLNPVAQIFVICVPSWCRWASSNTDELTTEHADHAEWRQPYKRLGAGHEYDAFFGLRNRSIGSFTQS